MLILKKNRIKNAQFYHSTCHQNTSIQILYSQTKYKHLSTFKFIDPIKPTARNTKSQIQSQSVTYKSSLVVNRKSTGNSCWKLQNFDVFPSSTFILFNILRSSSTTAIFHHYNYDFFCLTFFCMKPVESFCTQVFARIYLIPHNIFHLFCYL